MRRTRTFSHLILAFCSFIFLLVFQVQNKLYDTDELASLAQYNLIGTQSDGFSGSDCPIGCHLPPVRLDLFPAQNESERRSEHGRCALSLHDQQ